MKHFNSKILNRICIFTIIFLITFMAFQKNYAIGSEKFNSVKIKSFGMRHFPVIENSSLKTYIAVESKINLLFRIFIIDMKDGKTSELTQGYKNFKGDNGIYLLDFKNDFQQGNYKLKVWAKNPLSDREFDDEKITNAFSIIPNKNFDSNLIKDIKVDKLIEKNTKDINEIGVSSTKESLQENFENQKLSKDYDKIQDNKLDGEKKELDNKLIVKENIISKNSIALKNEYLGNDVGDTFIISSEGNDYRYKLHIYDINNKEWIIDQKEYRESCQWIPEKPGVYLLDLWTVSNKKDDKEKFGNDKQNKYDSVRLIPIIIDKPSNKVEIDSVIGSHYPILPGDKLSFYIKSKNVEKVQYRVWLLELDTGNNYDITKGYSNFVDANDYYEIKTFKDLEPGNYKLWIWARGVDCESSYDSYFSYSFSCNSNQPSFDATFAGDMKLNNHNIKVGDKLVVSGIDGLDNAFTNYRYKLLVYEIDEGKWNICNKEYSDKQEWTPDKPGKYILVLWVISDEFQAKEENKGKKYEGIKLNIIDVNESNEPNNNTDHIDDNNIKDDSLKNIKEDEYTLVLDFDDLCNGIEKGYKLFIKNNDVLKAYKKSIEVLNQIIKIDMSDFEKIIAVHDYIIKNTIYDEKNYAKSELSNTSYNSYGVLVDGKAVCQGYALTMKMLLDMLNIENYLVEGVTHVNGNEEDHVWNLVRLDNEFYHIDVTWDDPIPDENGKVRYSYFMLTDKVMSETHRWDNQKYNKSGKKDYTYFKSMYHPIIDNGWVYFSEEKDGYKLYKMKIGDNKKIKLTNIMAIFIDTDEDWIYFSNYSHGGYLYKIRKDGLGLTKLNDEYSKDIKVQGDWIIYKNEHNEEYYKIKKDGTEKKLCKE